MLHQCDSCEATMINGIYCHETGCPVEAGRKMNACRECGLQMDTDGRNALYCPSCDTCADCGTLDGHTFCCPQAA